MERTLKRESMFLLAAGLIGYPVCILAYWCLEPAYGLLASAAIVGANVGHGTRKTIANAVALAGCLLAIPATLAAMMTIGNRSPRLAVIGGAMSIVGWVAVFGTLILDPVAVQIVAQGPPAKELVDLFTRLANSPTIISLNILAALHLIGGILLGVAFWRDAPGSAVGGGDTHHRRPDPLRVEYRRNSRCRLDSVTWIALVAANVAILRELRSSLT